MRIRTLILLLTVAGVVGCATRPPEAPIRATTGNTVLVTDYWVAADNKADFERFLDEVLMPAFEEYYPAGEQPVRVWTTTDTSDEGHFQYRFVVDPMNEYYPFDVEAILKGIYAEDGETYAAQFDGFVEDEEEAEFQQTQW